MDKDCREINENQTKYIKINGKIWKQIIHMQYFNNIKKKENSILQETIQSKRFGASY